MHYENEPIAHNGRKSMLYLQLSRDIVDAFNFNELLLFLIFFGAIDTLYSFFYITKCLKM